MPTNKQRREAARRHLERQLQRRQEREVSRRKFTLVASIVGSVVLIAVIAIFVVAVGHDDKKPSAAASGSATSSATPSAAPTTSTPPLPLGTCKFVKGGTAAKKVTVPANTASTKGTAVATVQTTQGAITIALNRATAPCAVANFVSLSTQNYFNNTACHRLVTSGIFVLQCGDPTGTGSGGPGYSFNDELSGSEKYTAGVVAMANSGANTNGSQFFIVYKDSTSLPASYTVLGKVTSGLDVVTKVAAKGSNNANGTGDGKPNLAISITSVKIS